MFPAPMSPSLIAARLYLRGRKALALEPLAELCPPEVGSSTDEQRWWWPGQDAAVHRCEAPISLWPHLAAALVALAWPPPGPAQGPTDPATIGAWGAPFDIGVKGIHSIVLPNGRVLLFSYPYRAVGSDAYEWNPATGATTNVSLTWNRDIFCAGHSFLADGRLLLTGGHVHRGALRAGRQEHRLLRPGRGTFTSGSAARRGALVPDQRDAAQRARAGLRRLQERRPPPRRRPPSTPTTPRRTPSRRSRPRANKGYGNYPKLHLLANGKIAWTNLGAHAALQHRQQHLGGLGADELRRPRRVGLVDPAAGLEQGADLRRPERLRRRQRDRRDRRLLRRKPRRGAPSAR